MNSIQYNHRLRQLLSAQEDLLSRRNIRIESDNGIFYRYQYPVLTAAHVPISWRFDLHEETNPYLMERLGVNSVFNAGAIELEGTISLVARVEGMDRKSFFAVADSCSGVDNFRFRDYPITMPETDDPDINVYDIRLTQHEDGWIYGVFCTERKNPDAAPDDEASAVAHAGIARTKDLDTWERLPDLVTPSPQQRNVVLHPEFLDGKYAFYTRPQDTHIDVGRSGGIGWGLVEDIESPIINEEQIIDKKQFHTIKELKNGLGPPPIRTTDGWLHLAHGVRNTAAGLRYVLYMFMTGLDDPTKIIHAPGSYFMAPKGEERVGDVSNVVFSSGWVNRDNGEILIYYASSDTRIHVATSTIRQLIDYVKNTPEDSLRSHRSVQQRMDLIRRNQQFLASQKSKK